MTVLGFREPGMPPTLSIIFACVTHHQRRSDVIGRCLVTGATGLVGSHVAEAFRNKGAEVMALVREGTDGALLESLGVRIVRGNLNDVAAVKEATIGVDTVVHCAAKVGDWGPIDEYRTVNVEGLRNLLEAVRRNSLHRFVHLSSLGAYAARDHYGTDETEPLPKRHVDGYTQSKVEAEQLALQYQRDHGVPVVVLRPGFIYGPRDRTVLPRLLGLLAKGQVMYLGDGSQAMNTIFVGNLMDAIMLAAENPLAVGQVYNLTDGEAVSKRRFMESVADLAGLERPKRSVPLPVAKIAAFFMEGIARLVGAKEAPRITQARIKFLGLNLDFSIAKARRELGYQPRVKFDDALEETITWWKTHQKAPAMREECPAAAQSGYERTTPCN